MSCETCPKGWSLRFEKEGADMLSFASGPLNHLTVSEIVGLADHPMNRSRRIIVDLASVSELDSDGVYALLKLRERLLGLQLRNPAPAVYDVLRLTGLDVLLARLL